MNATLPSLTALRCFDASARHASITKAAQEIHLTQGAVSHQILGLEAQLATALFMRKKSGLELTSAGRAYWVEISSALRQLERATQNLVLNKGKGGALNLCVASTFSTYWLIPRLSGFVAAHPEVTLNLSTHIGPIDFSSAPHDAAIEHCEGAAPGLHAQLVLPLEVHPYASPALVKRSSLRVLLNAQPLIRHTTVPLAWPNWLACAKLQGAVAPEHLAGGPQYDLMSMALNGVIAGLGIALLPAYVADGALASKQIQRLSNVGWRSDKAYYLRYPEWKSELSALKRFREWLEETTT